MTTVSRTRSAEALVTSLAAVSAAAAIGGAGTAAGVRTWYPSLDRPSWRPPDEAFGPVWTVLYAAKRLRLARVARESRESRPALSLYGAAARTQRGMAAAVLRPQASRPRPRRDHTAVGGDRGDGGGVCAPTSGGCATAGPLPGVGDVRAGAEPRTVAAELLTLCVLMHAQSLGRLAGGRLSVGPTCTTHFVSGVMPMVACWPARWSRRLGTMRTAPVSRRDAVPHDPGWDQLCHQLPTVMMPGQTTEQVCVGAATGAKGMNTHLSRRDPGRSPLSRRA